VIFFVLKWRIMGILLLNSVAGDVESGPDVVVLLDWN
jgi:hypothetical protein